VRDDVEFEVLAGEPLEQKIQQTPPRLRHLIPEKTQPPARFRYTVSMNRQDGRWLVAAEFDGDPSKSSEPPPSQERPKPRSEGREGPSKQREGRTGSDQTAKQRAMR
jgi:hypothetical protein